MERKTLSDIVSLVRAETGQSLSPTQGLNTVETLKMLIQRTQYELWVSFVWPTLAVRKAIAVVPGQFLYDYDAELKFEQVRKVFWGAGAQIQGELKYGICETHIAPDGENTISAVNMMEWETSGENQFRLWPTPTMDGFIRMVGNRTLSPFVADSDMSTLDATLLSLLVATELLARAKAEDAQSKGQKAQRHLLRLLGLSQKNRVTTLGATRQPDTRRPRFQVFAQEGGSGNLLLEDGGPVSLEG